MSDEHFAPPKADLEAHDGQPSPPLWNPNAAGLWSLLFSPVFGSYLVLKNWQAIGAADKIQLGRLWLGVSVAMLIVSSLFPLGGFGYIIVWYFLWQSKQTEFVRARWGASYQRRGWAIPLAIAFGIALGVGLINALMNAP